MGRIHYRLNELGSSLKALPRETQLPGRILIVDEGT